MVTFDIKSFCASDAWILQTCAPSYVTFASLTRTALWIVFEFSAAGSSTISIQSGITNSRFWRSSTAASATRTTKRRDANAMKRALWHSPVLFIVHNYSWIDNGLCFYNIRAGRRSGITGLNERTSKRFNRQVRGSLTPRKVCFARWLTNFEIYFEVSQCPSFD